jgi:hypothetical protein
MSSSRMGGCGANHRGPLLFPGKRLRRLGTIDDPRGPQISTTLNGPSARRKSGRGQSNDMISGACHPNPVSNLRRADFAKQPDAVD